MRATSPGTNGPGSQPRRTRCRRSLKPTSTCCGKTSANCRSPSPSDPARGDLTHYAERIETLRQNRLADSTSNIPGIFWFILIAFVAATSFLAGREAPSASARR